MVDLLQNGNHLSDILNFVVRDEDLALLVVDAQLLLVVDKLRGDVPAVNLHALLDVNRGLESLPAFDAEHAIRTDAVERVCNHLADVVVVSRGDGCDRLDVAASRDRLRLRLEDFHELGAALVHSPLDVDWVGTRGDVLQPILDEFACQYGRGGGTVPRVVVRASRDFLDELRPCVFDGVLEVDSACNGDAVVDDLRHTERLVEHDVSPTRSERDLHRVRDFVDSHLKFVSRRGVEGDLLRDGIGSQGPTTRGPTRERLQRGLHGGGRDGRRHDWEMQV